MQKLSFLLVLALIGCGNSSGGSAGDANIPINQRNNTPAIDSGTYSVSVVLNMNSIYTTSGSAAVCQSLQSSPATYSWVVTDDANGGSTYSIGGSPQIAVTDGVNWIAESTPNTNCTSGAGCPCKITSAIILMLSAQSFVGSLVSQFNAEACNGVQNIIYNCAYDLGGTEVSSSDGSVAHVAVEHDLVSNLWPAAL